MIWAKVIEDWQVFQVPNINCMYIICHHILIWTVMSGLQWRRWWYSTVERFEKIWTKIKEKNKDMTIFWYGEDHQALAFSLRRPSCLWRSGCAYVEYVADMKLADTLWTSTDSLPTSIYSRRTSTDSLLTSTDSLLTCTDSLLNLYWLLLTLYWLLLTLYWLLLMSTDFFWRLRTLYCLKS